MASHRARRAMLALLALPVLFLLFLYLASPVSRRTFSDLFSTDAQPRNLPDEIFGLLHFVTSPDEAGRVISAVGDPAHDGVGAGIAPEHPVPLAWYALGSTARTDMVHARGVDGWEGRLKVLREEHPLVVFSKSRCPYSERAKRLLETYELTPAPKVVEVDLRADSSHIKTLLTRLTHRSTFPNVILHGRSLGGSDDLVRLHEADELRPTLEKAGVRVGRRGTLL